MGTAALLGINVGFTLLGMLLGLVLGNRRATRLLALQRQTPRCTCAHLYNVHLDGVCRDRSKVRSPLGGWTWINCPCIKYIGPVPAEAFWPEINK